MYNVIILTPDAGFSIVPAKDFKDARAIAIAMVQRPGNHGCIYDQDGCKTWEYTAPKGERGGVPSGWLVHDSNLPISGYLYGDGDRDRAINAAINSAKREGRPFYVKDRYGFVEFEASPDA